MISTVNEFPFVEGLPKRQVSAVRSAWDALEDFRALTRRHGGLVPPGAAAVLLGVHRSRVYQLIEAGRLEVVAYGVHQYVAADSLERWAKAEHPVGRPRK